ncbi:hypothetical protein QFC19_001114 [Naganishia cerealis]|uniref:Uncharacterized protein n=1 Tax=Naganishia cerealis TaxID=610337 RepID=A0ACC2WJS5_9TREE|nr:hypothetical protein QFC19_001114 [Naganishia cerealis]
MTQHTAQHLLSAICDTHLALPTLSWFMPPHPSTEPCYIELPRSLTPSEASAMEDICNSLVTRRWGAQGEGEEVKVWIESRLQKRGGGGGGDKALTSAIAGLSVGNGGGEERKMTDQVEVEEAQGLGMLSNLKPGGFAVHDEEEREWADRESRGLPRDYAGGVIRTAVIDGIDRNPTDVNRSLAPNSLLRNTASPASDDDHHDSHLILPPSSFLLHSHPTLSKIGLIHVLPPTTVSQKPTRLYMVAGHRATRHLIAASAELTRASVAVGCSRDQLAARAEQREQGRREMVRWQERMRQELAKALGVAVVWRPTMTTHEGAGTVGEIQCAVVSRAEEATHDFEFLSALNVAAVDALKTTAEAEVESAATTGHSTSEGLPRYALAVHSTVVPMANNGITEAGSLVLITTNPPDLAREYGDKLKAALDVIPGQEKGRCKGGGAKGRWMGKVSGKWSRADAVALEKLLSA